MPKICPLRIQAWERLRNCEVTGKIIEELGYLNDFACLQENCAWWNDDFGECAILALATVATRPAVIKEQLGHD